uniref:NADH dehydrogenase subunit 6 n=1 Tax=Eucoleus annulatus TaxID=2831232 RepID=A0A8E8LSP4_9BILA|nr:NADH dehydrogenase subunit 6 [Eucoleus annulatus]QWC93301.1 NADH dehydrogenase subunit 6 [Eucoleus annulatus]
MFLFIMLICSLFLIFTHPLWISLMVFICSIFMAFEKFFYGNSMNLFIFLFIMVYSGGLLLMLVYMSSLVPNFNLINFGPVIMAIMMITLISSVYTENYFHFFSDFNFKMSSLFSLKYILSSKEMMYSIIFLLTFCFCFVASVLSMLKYPMRSL